MKICNQEILETVWRFYDVPVANQDVQVAAIGWRVIARLLEVSVRHCQDLFRTDGFFSPWIQESMCKITYVAIPPNRMAVFYCGARREDEMWDQMGAAAPTVCHPQAYASWRYVGGPFYRHVTNLWERFPHLDAEDVDGINGGMAITTITKARLIPVCWNSHELLRMERFRKQANSIKKAAAGAGFTTNEYLRIKSPNFVDDS